MKLVPRGPFFENEVELQAFLSKSAGAGKLQQRVVELFIGTGAEFAIMQSEKRLPIKA
jgi:hypothetical protein